MTPAAARAAGTRTGPGAWCRVPRPAPHAAVRLYAFPHAGGSAAVFQSWAGYLPADVELRAVQLPGRHDRALEEPHTDADSLADALFTALRPEFDERPFAFFGHSMGAMLAFRLAQLLARSGGPQPVLTGVSGWAPDVPRRPALPSGDLPEAEFVRAVQALGGIPQEVLATPGLLEFVLPTLRADFRVCDGYRPLEGPPVAGPVVGYTGDADPLVTPQDMAAWAGRTRHFLGGTVHRGDHFYLDEHGPAVVADFVRHLRDRLRQAPPAVRADPAPAPLPVP